jgi:uncharacterized membrane protein
MALALAMLIGLLAGLRSMMAPAVVAWAVHLGRLHLGPPASYLGSTAAVAVLTILAVGELIFDKLPIAPSRTAALGLLGRMMTGGISGICIAAVGGQSPVLGGILGAVGGVAGAFLGYRVRKHLVKALGAREFSVALAEDVVAIAGSVAVVWLV